MNGVRRLLAVATSSGETAVDAVDQKGPSSIGTPVSDASSWSPTSTRISQSSSPQSPELQTLPLLLKYGNRQKTQPPTPPPDEEPAAFNNAYRINTMHSTTSSSNRRVIKRKSPPHAESISDMEWRPASINRTALPTVRDELLLSLLASQALVDSRDLEILDSEQVDELKKEHRLLASRLEAANKRLTLELKIRDAAVSLAKVNAAHRKVSKKTELQLEAANVRVDSAQKELWRVSERAYDIHKRLMDHRAGILSYSLHTMENNIPARFKLSSSNRGGSDSGYGTTLLSPRTSVTSASSVASSQVPFDGPHLFAGHANASIPQRLEVASTDITVLETKLKAATEALTAAGKKQAELTRELSMIRLEKQEVEALMAMDLQSAEETINALERELPRLEALNDELQQLKEEKKSWQGDRVRLEEQLERGSGPGAVKLLEEKESEIRRITTMLNAEREAWESRRVETLSVDDAKSFERANQDLDKGFATLEALVRHHGIVLFTRDSSFQGLLSAVGSHLETIHNKLNTHAKAEAEWETLRRKLDDDIRAGYDKREALVCELEEARRERDVAKDELRNNPGVGHTTIYKPSESTLPDSLDKILQILIPVWNILPSPEARAAKFCHGRQFRTAQAPASPVLPSLQLPGTAVGAKTPPVTSLSELDVRSLKSLYDQARGYGPNGHLLTPGAGAGGEFSIEAFAARVHALIQDDRSIIERLVRFAQAHDLLKQNADRAQKLAQEGNNALETYQKQVRTLEERNNQIAASQIALQDEFQNLQDEIGQLEKEKKELEQKATQKAEAYLLLKETNSTLNAKTLKLAQEMASAPDLARKLDQTKSELDVALLELDAMRNSEQTQRIALLEELNAMQTENGALRAQLRARK